MDSGAAALDEFGDGRFGVSRLEQLHLRLAEGERHDGGPVGDFGRMGCKTEDITIELQGLVETLDRDPDMGDARGIRHWDSGVAGELSRT